VKLTAPQQTISDSPARFRVAVCGRRFGKTFLACNEIAKVARFPGRNIFFIFPTYRMAKMIGWDLIKDQMTRVRWVRRINESDLSIVLRNGSRISLKGSDNPDSLRGNSLDLAVFDEFAMQDQKVWTEVIRPTLSDRAGSALFISTPLGTSNWAFDLYNRGRDDQDGTWASFSFTTIEGGNVSQEEIEQARTDLDERTFRQEFLATWEEYANRIFYAFDRKLNVCRYTDPVPDILHIGLDFNVGQMSAAIFAQKGTQVHAIDEISLHSSNTQEVVDEILARYPGKKIFVYPDPAGAARKTSAASGVTDHTILANAGFVVRAPRAHDPVRDGINAVNSRLCSATGARTLVIDPGCRKIIDSLEKHTYRAGSSQPDKDSGHDHMTDAVRYYIGYAFPVRRDSTPTAPQRWGHRI